jgi:hypothetical protein
MMCEPTTLMLAASAIASVVGTAQAATAQQSALTASTNQQYKQINDQAAQEQSQHAIQTNAEQAKIRVAAGESGVGGASVAAQMMDVLFQQSYDTGLINKNRSNALEAAQTGSQAKMAEIKQPDYLGAGLQIAGAYSDMQTKAGKTFTGKPLPIK